MASRKRPPSKIRTISIEPNYVNRDGSALFKFGDSAVVCSVNGPTEVKLRDEKVDKATIDVIFKPLVGLPGTKDKTHEYIIRSTVESVIKSNLYPRTLIQIVCQVMMDDGNILATAINATTYALMNAGVEMKDIAVAVACIVNKDGNILIDPELREIGKAQSYHTFAFSKTSFGLLFCESTGLFTEEQYFECYAICKIAAQEIIDKIRVKIQSDLT
ncbi:ribosomal protein S5 domain 2-like protein [Gigaspora margarita]|uniref:Ribosomal protein S5 domain 2-like protein n=1 Tax=Gigaspora margarita TaxID=4874 RepID=A0A8H3X2M8_GIGMA|nr:ribosomal protein S5 domain 2-like protein [Gigaspora margarita]